MLQSHDAEVENVDRCYNNILRIAYHMEDGQSSVNDIASQGEVSYPAWTSCMSWQVKTSGYLQRTSFCVGTSTNHTSYSMKILIRFLFAMHMIKHIPSLEKGLPPAGLYNIKYG